MGLNIYCHFFAEFADIERTRNLMQSIKQVNQSIKNQFNQSQIQTQSFLKTYPQEISKFEEVVVAKKQISEGQPRISELKAGLKKRRRLAIIPLVLLLLLAPLSYSVYSTLPELPNPDDHVTFEMLTYKIYITHSDKNLYSMSDLVDLNSNIERSYSEYLNNTSTWSTNYQILPSISTLLHLSMNSTNPELESIDIRGSPNPTAWPAEMRVGEVAVTPRNTSTIVQHLVYFLGFTPDGRQIENQECFEYASHCSIIDKHMDYEIAVNKTGSITRVQEKYSENSFYLYEGKVSGCEESIGYIQTDSQVTFRGIIGTGQDNNYLDSDHVKTEDNYRQFAYFDSHYRFALAGVDNFIPNGKVNDCFSEEDIHQPELLRYIIRERVYNEDTETYEFDGWEPSGAERMSMYDVCESISFPISSTTSAAIIEQPAECTKRTLSIPIIVTLVFTFMIAVMIRSSNEQKSLVKTERLSNQLISLSGMKDKSVEELNQIIHQYSAFMQEHTPLLNTSAQLNQEIQQRERQSNESDIWSDSHTPPNSPTSPPTNVMGIPDDKGYEWTKSEDGSDWYRILGSNSEWQRFEA